LTDENVAQIVLAGRTRWKVENENNNTLKTKGYNLEHNFGHGKQHLSSFFGDPEHLVPPLPHPARVA
jgi:hypothetical protein